MMQNVSPLVGCPAPSHLDQRPVQALASWNKRQPRFACHPRALSNGLPLSPQSSKSSIPLDAWKDHAKCSLQMRTVLMIRWHRIAPFFVPEFPLQAETPSSPFRFLVSSFYLEVFKFEEGSISFAKWPQSCSQKSNLGCRQCLPGKIRPSLSMSTFGI